MYRKNLFLMFLAAVLLCTASQATQLAVVVDDSEMQITEVARGEDLLRSTARQLLLHEAFNTNPPAFYHCPLVVDESGRRLAKRYDSLSLRQLRARGQTPEQLRAQWNLRVSNSETTR